MRDRKWAVKKADVAQSNKGQKVMESYDRERPKGYKRMMTKMMKKMMTKG